MSAGFRTRTSVFILLVFILSYCQTPQKKEKKQFKRFYLPEHEIAFYIPGDWTVNQDHYFHFKAVGFAPNGLPASVEYRGLDFKALNDKSKDLYARGWYDAISANYPEWQYRSKDKKPGDAEGSYEFEGTYRVATDTFRRFGRLRFRGMKLHAIYFTGIDTDYEKVKQLFETLDGKIEYAPGR